MKLFKPTPTKELQAELKAVVERIIVDPYQTPLLFDRYERLLAEIYKRGEQPEKTLTVRKE